MKKNNLILITALTMILSLCLPTNFSDATNEFKLQQTEGTVTIEGNSSTKLSVQITNTTSSKLTNVVAKINTSNLPHEPFSDKEISFGDIESKKTVLATWNINTSDTEFSKTYTLPVTVTCNEGLTSTQDSVIYVFPDDSSTSTEKVPKANISITPTSNKLSAGSSSSLTVNVSNVGNTILNDLVVSLSSLPTGISLNNYNLNVPIGSLPTSKSKSINVPIVISKSVEEGNYGFTATVTGSDGDKKPASFTQTSFLEIKGSNSSSSSLSINNFKVPAEVGAGATFNSTFTLSNDSTTAVKNVKVTIKGGEGLINKSKNIFTETNFAGGASKNFNITFFTLNKTESKNIPIEVIVEYLDEGMKDPITFSQYEGVFINGSKEGDGTGVKTPQLIVNSYTYGGDSVRAGEEFQLNYTLYNTNKDKNLRNIKVALSSDEGTFIPVGSSNTMFIENIGTRKAASKSIVLSCKPDAPQKTVAVTLDITYEDTKGSEYTAKEIISVPVVQKTKLKIDDISLPPEAHVGEQTNISANFYNVGKTTLSNFTVTAEGNFDVPQSPSYFVGNLEAGKQDSYDLVLIPKELGPVKGKIIFSFEDLEGKSQHIEKEFTFNAIEAPPIDDGTIQPPVEESGISIGKKIALGAGMFSLLAISVFVFRHRKKKKEQELTIDEE
ncbi:MAG: COG1361 S-layer family protein [Filifactoraceae bacterium]